MKNLLIQFTLIECGNWQFVCFTCMWRLIWLGWLFPGLKHFQLSIKLTALLSKWNPKSTKSFYEYRLVQGKTISFLSLFKIGVLNPHKEDRISLLSRHRLINLPLTLWKLLLNKKDILLHWDKDFAIEWALHGKIIIGFVEHFLNKLFKINQVPMLDIWYLD